MVHSFADGGDYEEAVPLFSNHWKIEKRFGIPDAKMDREMLRVTVPALDGGVLWLKR